MIVGVIGINYYTFHFLAVFAKFVAIFIIFTERIAGSI
ncbi:hypothetical protein KIS4809_3815 [Bacillus sp. ZZV12-4809]|nr:hypothetical protein KIS4809_3815 [Bacillus sp. ZZV12-4809]